MSSILLSLQESAADERREGPKTGTRAREEFDQDRFQFFDPKTGTAKRETGEGNPAATYSAIGGHISAMAETNGRAFISRFQESAASGESDPRVKTATKESIDQMKFTFGPKTLTEQRENEHPCVNQYVALRR